MDKISHHFKLFPCQRERGSWQISQGRFRKSLFKDRGVARKPYHLNVGQCDLFSSLILPPLFFHSLSFFRNLLRTASCQLLASATSLWPFQTRFSLLQSLVSLSFLFLYPPSSRYLRVWWLQENMQCCHWRACCKTIKSQGSTVKPSNKLSQPLRIPAKTSNKQHPQCAC